MVMVRRNSVTPGPGSLNWYSMVIRPSRPPLPSRRCPSRPTELNTNIRGRMAIAHCQV